MTIEIRQMLIKSSVEDDDRPLRSQDGDAASSSDQPDGEQARLELLAECKAWLFDKMQNQRER